MASWQTQSSKVVYKTAWFRTYEDTVLNHKKAKLTYSYLELVHPAVYIAAVNKTGQVLIIQQFRYPIKERLWELPAGHSDGEDLLRAAKRELLEEAGLSSTRWIRLNEKMLFQADGVANIPFVGFLAQDTYQTTPKLDEEEDIITQKFIDFDKLDSMIMSGEFREAGHIAVIQLAKLYIARGAQ